MRNCFRKTIIAFITTLMSINGFLSFGSCKKQSSEQIEQPLKVMTFNIRLDAPSDSINNWKYRKSDVCKMIKYYQPDLLGMQEVCYNQKEYLKQELTQYSMLGVGRDDGKEAGEHCPIFFNTSRFTLLRHGDFSLSEIPDSIGIKGWDASYNRIATWAILQEKTGRKIFIYLNTHLDNDGNTARKKGVQLILDKIKEVAPNIPAIITGDFNCKQDEEPILILEKMGMQNAYKAAGIIYGPPWSFHDFGRLSVEKRTLIDYVFVSDGSKIDRCRVIQDKSDNSFLSDHCPVLVDLTLK